MGPVQIQKKIEHLRLDSYVQGRHRLICHDKFRIQNQSSADTDSLPLTAGQFIRIPLCI